MESVQNAIATLYAGIPEASAAANQYLMEFMDNQAAWGVSIDLLAVQPALDANVQYFAANTLYTKIRKHWHQLELDHRSQLSAAMLGLLQKDPDPQQALGNGAETLAYPKVVMGRLCLALAAIAVRAPGGIDAFVNEAFKFSQQQSHDGSHAATNGTVAARGVRCAGMQALLQMLDALPDEVDGADVSRSRRLELTDDLLRHVPRVLEAVLFTITQVAARLITDYLWGMSSDLLALRLQGGKDWGPDLARLALTTAAKWVALGVSLSSLATVHEALFRQLLHVLQVLTIPPSGSDLSVACQVINVLNAVLAVDEYPRPASTAAEAYLSALQCLPALYAKAVSEDDEDSCLTLCAAATNFASKEMALVASASEVGLHLVVFILQCTGSHWLKVALLSLDFWLELQDVPVSERHPSLGHPVYVKLLDVLLAQCQYPQNFSSFDSYSEEHWDPEAFRELREGAQGVNDVHVVIYYLLRTHFFKHIMDRLKLHGASWQALEVSLLTVTMVSKEMKGLLRTEGKGPDAEESRALLCSMLQELLVNPMVSSTPLVLSAGCQFVGGFSQLLLNQGQMLVPALSYLKAGLRESDASMKAAKAMRNICVTCDRAVAGNDQALQLLLGVLEEDAVAGTGIEEKLILVESAVRILAMLDVAVASPLAVQLTSPALGVLATELQKGSQLADPEKLSQSLELMAQAVRFMDAPPEPSGAHIALDLLSRLWPLLEAAAQRMAADEQVVISLFTLMGKMFTSLRETLARQVHVPTLLKVATDCFESHKYPCCLDCLSSAVEVYGAEAAPHFQQIMTMVTKQTFARVQEHSHPGECPHLIKAFYDLAARFCMFCPVGLIHCGELGGILQLGLECLRPQNLERYSTCSVLMLITQLANQSQVKLQAFKSEVDAALVAIGPSLTHLILTLLAGSAPSLVWPTLIDCIYALLSQVGASQGGIGHSWVFNALAADGVCPALTEEDRRRVMEAVMRLTGENKRRFKALMLDFAKICHHEMTADGLLAYLM
ncbi:unnamed protein product [Chrysoparadoxa australica]